MCCRLTGAAGPGAAQPGYGHGEEEEEYQSEQDAAAGAVRLQLLDAALKYTVGDVWRACGLLQGCVAEQAVNLPM